MSHALGLTRQVLVFSLNHYECDTNGPHVYTSISYYVLCTEHIYNDPQTSDDIAQFFFRGIARSSLEKLKKVSHDIFHPTFHHFIIFIMWPHWCPISLVCTVQYTAVFLLF